jgi:hypothetical protein
MPQHSQRRRMSDSSFQTVCQSCTCSHYMTPYPKLCSIVLQPFLKSRQAADARTSAYEVSPVDSACPPAPRCCSAGPLGQSSSANSRCSRRWRSPFAPGPVTAGSETSCARAVPWLLDSAAQARPPSAAVRGESVLACHRLSKNRSRIGFTCFRAQEACRPQWSSPAHSDVPPCADGLRRRRSRG